MPPPADSAAAASSAITASALLCAPVEAPRATPRYERRAMRYASYALLPRDAAAERYDAAA